LGSKDEGAHRLPLGTMRRDELEHVVDGRPAAARLGVRRSGGSCAPPPWNQPQRMG
jgi:hypothetical protein